MAERVKDFIRNRIGDVIFTVLVNMGVPVRWAHAIATVVENAIFVTAVAAAAYGINRLLQKDLDNPDEGNDIVLSSGTAPQRVIYGQAVAGGVVMYQNVVGETGRRGNEGDLGVTSDFYIWVAVAGHKCEDITDLFFNDEPVLGIRKDTFKGSRTAEEHSLTQAEVDQYYRDHFGDPTPTLSYEMGRKETEWRDPGGKVTWEDWNNVNFIDWSRNTVTRGRWSPASEPEVEVEPGAGNRPYRGEFSSTWDPEQEGDDFPVRAVRVWKYLGGKDQNFPPPIQYNTRRGSQKPRTDTDRIEARQMMPTEPPGYFAPVHSGGDVDWTGFSGFPDITVNHRARGITTVLARFRYYEEMDDYLSGGIPRLRFVVKGKHIYDPRRDPTQPFVRQVADTADGKNTKKLDTPDAHGVLYEVEAQHVHDFDDEDTHCYCANPILCAADYEHNFRRTNHSPISEDTGVQFDRFNWLVIAQQADICDEIMIVPGEAWSTTKEANGGYNFVESDRDASNWRSRVDDLIAANELEEEPRFECNVNLSLGSSTRENLEKILAACGGTRIIVKGKIELYAAAFREPVNSDPITEDHIGDSFQLRTGIPYSERINTVSGVLIDKRYNFHETAMPSISFEQFRERDRGEAADTVSFESVTSIYQAQRLAYMILRRSNQQRFLTIPLDMCGLMLTPESTVCITLPAFDIQDDVYRCNTWQYNPGEGITVSLQSETESVYDDVPLLEYHRVVEGQVDLGEPSVPKPYNFTMTGTLEGIESRWVVPKTRRMYDRIQLWHSDVEDWDGAVDELDEDGNPVMNEDGTTSQVLARQLVWEGFANEITLPYEGGTTKYGWVRAAKNNRYSARDPDEDTSEVTATARSVISVETSIRMYVVDKTITSVIVGGHVPDEETDAFQVWIAPANNPTQPDEPNSTVTGAASELGTFRHQFIGLESGTRYFVYGRARYDLDDGSTGYGPTDILQIITNIQTGYEVVGVSTHEVMASVPDEGPLAEYEWQVDRGLDPASVIWEPTGTSIVTATSGTTIDLAGIYENQRTANLAVTVRCRVRIGGGEWGGWVIVGQAFTLQDPSAPGAPTSPTIAVDSTTGVFTLSWTAPTASVIEVGHTIVRYGCRLWKDNGVAEWLGFDTVDDTNDAGIAHELTSPPQLNSGWYRFACNVITENAAGDRFYSDEAISESIFFDGLDVTSLVSISPRQIRLYVAQKELLSITVAIVPADEKPTRYTLSIEDSTGAAAADPVTLDPDMPGGLLHRFTGLSRGTSYLIRGNAIYDEDPQGEEDLLSASTNFLEGYEVIGISRTGIRCTVPNAGEGVTYEWRADAGADPNTVVWRPLSTTPTTVPYIEVEDLGADPARFGRTPNLGFTVECRTIEADGTKSGWTLVGKGQTYQHPDAPGIPRNLTISVDANGIFSLDWDDPDPTTITTGHTIVRYGCRLWRDGSVVERLGRTDNTTSRTTYPQVHSGEYWFACNCITIDSMGDVDDFDTYYFGDIAVSEKITFDGLNVSLVVDSDAVDPRAITLYIAQRTPTSLTVGITPPKEAPESYELTLATAADPDTPIAGPVTVAAGTGTPNHRFDNLDTSTQYIVTGNAVYPNG